MCRAFEVSVENGRSVIESARGQGCPTKTLHEPKATDEVNSYPKPSTGTPQRLHWVAEHEGAFYEPPVEVDEAVGEVNLFGGAVVEEFYFAVAAAIVGGHQQPDEAVGGVADEDIHLVAVRTRGAVDVAVVDRVDDLRVFRMRRAIGPVERDAVFEDERFPPSPVEVLGDEIAKGGIETHDVPGVDSGQRGGWLYCLCPETVWISDGGYRMADCSLHAPSTQRQKFT